MGVQGLWELLAPVGRRVYVETLTGKKLAIDASIWMVQFMKAMRDERGEMVRNAHILGFFRRICKLLFLRTKPVFVFDGGTPVLKRRTIAARRRHRENARAKIRKTAEKLLLNHLKSKRLEELAEEIKRSKSEVKEDFKGKKIESEDDGSLGLGKDNSYERSNLGFDEAVNQEKLDELLAASISAEEEEKLLGNETGPTEDVRYEEEGEEGEEEEMVLPANTGNIDPAVLASLPPSMQLDLLDQMRERLMADNRQKYQKIKKVPSKFSELQIQSYLKTVAFRREINEVQKCASGRGFGGLQTSRIASEANREYIFSSSFVGDKQMLTPTGTEKNGGIVKPEMRTTGLDTSKLKLFMSPSKSNGNMNLDVVTGEMSQDVETYLDERGRVRVSRVRGLGIRMTRDLQRNLDLMKEHDKMFLKKNLNKIPETISNIDASDFPEGQSQIQGIPNPFSVNEKNNHCTSVSIATEGIFEEFGSNTLKSTTVPAKEAAIEVSFSEEEIGSKTMVDDFFMNLVSENPTTEFFSESISLEKSKDDFEQEGIWEDGMVGEQNLGLEGLDIQSSFIESNGCEEDIWVDGEQYFTLKVDDIQSSLVESKVHEENEVLRENGMSFVSHLEESEKVVSRGFLEEETDMKEAIRRSLDDFKSKHSSSAIPVEENMRTTIENHNSSISVNNGTNIEFQMEGDQLQSDMMDFLVEKGCFGRSNAHQFVASPNEVPSTCSVSVGRFDIETTLKCDEKNVAVSNTDVGLPNDIQVMEQSINQSSQENLFKIDSNLVVDEPNVVKTDECVLGNHPNINSEIPDCSLDTSLSNVLNNSVASLSTNTSEIRSNIPSCGATLCIGISDISSTEKMASSIGEIQQLADKDVYEDSAEGLSFSDQASMLDEHKIAVAEANLHDEISFLKQERSFLGDEQRKLERNAESVSSEMFAECQELLQMFGLPYIIAPMEAEAQCAYMEMNYLVDGIVTDDSDVFLFGARNVYKNIFDDRKYVETYFMKDIESELGLSRDKLLCIALLLGSDYTEGVSGIGIVNAIEVINAFPEKDGLLKFKEWVESPDIGILRSSQYGGNLNKVSSNTNGSSTDGMETSITCSAHKEGVLENDQPSDNAIPDTKKKLIFMDKHRNVSKNWHFPPSFPSEFVITAYISPQIDESIEPFSWGKPDLPLLRKICWEKFGWPNQKADDLLLPVLKEYNKHETQLRMEAFYSFNERFAKIRSQRIKKAVKDITGISSSGLTNTIDGESTSKRKRGTTLCNNEHSQLDNYTNMPTKNERKSLKKSRKNAPIRTSSGLSEGSGKRVVVNDKRAEIVNARSGSEHEVRTARGRGRGKCKRGDHLNECLSEPSDDELHRFKMMDSATPEMRRSTRKRRQVNYTEDNAELNNELQVPEKPIYETKLKHDKMSMKEESFNQKKKSQDYLFTGGGFCLEGDV